MNSFRLTKVWTDNEMFEIEVKINTEKVSIAQLYYCQARHLQRAKSDMEIFLTAPSKEMTVSFGELAGLKRNAFCLNM